MRIKLSTALMILGIVFLPTNLTADSNINKEDNISMQQVLSVNEAVLGEMDSISPMPSRISTQTASLDSITGEFQPLNLSLPFNVKSNWISADSNTPNIVWKVGDNTIKFAIQDGKFISTSPQDTWFIYGWFGPIEAVTKPYNIKYPRWGNRHNGIDFAGRLGLDIISASNGTIIFTGNKIGQTVEIDAGNNYLITYGHLQDITVSVGDKVNSGDLIGHLGATGTINPHLHFEIDKTENGYRTAINPLTLLEVDWNRVIIPDADANRFYKGSQDPRFQPNFNW